MSSRQTLNLQIGSQFSHLDYHAKEKHLEQFFERYLCISFTIRKFLKFQVSFQAHFFPIFRSEFHLRTKIGCLFLLPWFFRIRTSSELISFFPFSFFFSCDNLKGRLMVAFTAFFVSSLIIPATRKKGWWKDNSFDCASHNHIIHHI